MSPGTTRHAWKWHATLCGPAMPAVRGVSAKGISCIPPLDGTFASGRPWQSVLLGAVFLFRAAIDEEWVFVSLALILWGAAAGIQWLARWMRKNYDAWHEPPIEGS